MTVEEVKQQLDAVVNALDKVQISGYQNLCNVQGSIAVLLKIINSNINVEKS